MIIAETEAEERMLKKLFGIMTKMVYTSRCLTGVNNPLQKAFTYRVATPEELPMLMDQLTEALQEFDKAQVAWNEVFGKCFSPS